MYINSHILAWFSDHFHVFDDEAATGIVSTNMNVERKCSL